MTSPAQIRPASLRLLKAISALQPALLAAFALGAAPLRADTTITPGYNAYSTESTLALGALTRNPGGAAFFSGSGTISATATLENGLVGPWAIVQRSGTSANNSPDGFTFATLSGGNITPYTAATSQTSPTAWGGIPAGGTGTINYDVNTATVTATGSLRTINTLRYTGTGVRQMGNNAADLLSLNGLMNAGTGTLTIGRNGANITNDFSFGILAGANRDLVLAPLSANLVLYSFIKNNAGGASNVTVAGNNTVELAAANAYTGATTIASGTLLVSGAGSINTTSGISVNGPAAKYVHTSGVASTPVVTLTRGTVDGTGTLGTVVVADDVTNVVQNGNAGTGALTVGTLTFNGDATLKASLAAGTRPFTVTGTLTTTPASGTITVNVATSGLPTGTHNLLGFGSFAGSLSDFSLGAVTGLNSRQSAGGLSLSGSNLAIQINGDSPRWTGAQSGAWTTDAVGGAGNWKLVTSGTVTEFLAGDEALFDDTATGTTHVEISTANVSPAATTFNNSSKNYTISSPGGFGIITGALIKNGSGTVTLTTVNTYTSATTINAGTLQLGDGSTDGSIATSNGIANHGSLVYNLIGNQSYAAGITGTGNLGKSGPGVLTLTGANTYSGGTTVNDGTLAFGGTSALGTGGIVIGTGATLSSNGSTLSNPVTGTGSYVSASGQGVIGGNWTGFSGTVSTSATADMSFLNNVTGGVFNGTSENAAYVNNYAANNTNGMIIANTSGANLTVKMGSYASVALSNLRNSGGSANVVTYEIGALNTDTTVAGGIGGGGGTMALRKVGTGTLTIAGTGSYAGGTAVNGGTLRVNGALSNAANSVAIAAGGTLAGSGTIAGAVNVNGGSLAPGAPVGVLSVNGPLTLSPGSTTTLEINGLTRGTEYDGLTLPSTFTRDGTVRLQFGGILQTGVYTLFQTSGTTLGSFAAITASSTATPSPVSLNDASGVWTGTLDGFELSFNSSTGMLTVSTPAHTPLQTWRFDQFGVYDDTAGVLAGDTEDFDGDGLANLLEYALDTDPKAPTASPLTAGRSGNFLTLTYSRRSPADPALTYTVEGSDNLAAGFIAATGATNTVGSTSTYTDDVDAVATGRRFLRLTVTHTP